MHVLKCSMELTLCIILKPFCLVSFQSPFHPPKVTHFGCKSFALLFDDIDHNMCPADKEVFSSFAHAQVSITNEIYQYLGEPETFLFCPTGTSVLCLSFAYLTHLYDLFFNSLFV